MGKAAPTSQHHASTSKYPIPRLDLSKRSESPSTVLYLAYGSNLCAATFQGQRAIRPKSALNVYVPDMQMVFDLPGVPYSEPRFANSRFRTRQAAENLLDSAPTSEKSCLLSRDTPASERGEDYRGWRKGLVGVVYEVSRPLPGVRNATD